MGTGSDCHCEANTIWPKTLGRRLQRAKKDIRTELQTPASCDSACKAGSQGSEVNEQATGLSIQQRTARLSLLVLLFTVQGATQTRLHFNEQPAPYR